MRALRSGLGAGAGVVAVVLALAGCTSRTAGAPPAGGSAVSPTTPRPVATAGSRPASAPASLSGDPAAVALYRRSVSALANAPSARITGTAIDSGQAMTVDLSFVSGVGSTGTITVSGGTMKLISVGGHLYVDIDAQAFEVMTGGQPPTDAAGATVARWIDFGPAGESNPLGDFATFTDLASFAAQLTPSGRLSLGQQTTVDGTSVQAIKIAAGGGAGPSTLYVEAGDNPLPVELVLAPAASASASSGSGAGPAGGSSGTLHFGDYGAAVNITAPSDAVPVSALEQLLAGASPSG